MIALHDRFLIVQKDVAIIDVSVRIPHVVTVLASDGGLALRLRRRRLYFGFHNRLQP